MVMVLRRFLPSPKRKLVSVLLSLKSSSMVVQGANTSYIRDPYVQLTRLVPVGKSSRALRRMRTPFWEPLF